MVQALAHEGVADALSLLLEEAAAEGPRAGASLFAATAFSPAWHLHVAAAQLSDAQHRETRKRPLSVPALAAQIRSNLRRGVR